MTFPAPPDFCAAPSPAPLLPSLGAPAWTPGGSTDPLARVADHALTGSPVPRTPGASALGPWK